MFARVYPAFFIGEGASAEGTRSEAPSDEAPQALREVGCGEGVPPSPLRRGLGRGPCPFPTKFLFLFTPK